MLYRAKELSLHLVYPITQEEIRTCKYIVRVL
jgi:hypothetical protein